MRIEPEISGVSVVLLGNFNPAIFTPAWFSLHGLLARQAADNANLRVAHPELTAFSTEWLHLHVTTDRFQAETQLAPHVRIADLVVRVFREHVYHTPVRAIGINRNIHFLASSKTARDRLGKMLAPVEPWGELAETLELAGDQNGLVSLAMRQSNPAGRPRGGQVNVKVEPSVKVGDGRLGVYVQVNDHYEIDPAVPDTDGREQLFGFLENGFDSSVQRAEKIVDHIMSLAKVL